MARIVLVVICGVLVFVFVSKFAPHFLETIGTANPEATAAAEEEANSKPKSKAKSSAPKSKANAAARTASKAAPASTTPVADELLPVALNPETTPETPAPAADSRPVVKVAAENATLYLTNTAGGPVVARLSKGAVVEPVFVVSTAGQNWTFVSAGDNELTGFIRSETLTRTKAAETARQ